MSESKAVPSKLDPADAPEFSVVIPIYRNAASLIELLDRLDLVLADESREYVFVVDGSPDDSLELLKAESKRRPHLRVIELSRNFGQHAALCAGFELARGRCALVLDGDLQQRPEDLPKFMAAWREGADFVSGWRSARADSIWRRFASRCFNGLVCRMTGVRLHDWGCPLAAIDRSVFQRIAPSGEQRRFLKPLVAKLSTKPTEVQVEGYARDGASSYSPLALVGLTLDFVVSFSNRPFLKLIGIGAAGFSAGLLIGTLYVLLRIVGLLPEEPRILAAVVLLVLLGVQVLILGALGEFTHRIYRLVQGAPFFQVAAEHGSLESDAAEPLSATRGEPRSPS